METAGETTAAVMIGGPPDTRPVGEDSLAKIKVAEAGGRADGEDG